MSHYDNSEATFACYICSDSHYDRCGPIVCVKIKMVQSYMQYVSY